MTPIYRLTENWFTRPPRAGAGAFTVVLTALVVAMSVAAFGLVPGAEELLTARGADVFGQGALWRAWSTLFVHGDFGHLSSNLLLFIPLTYLLAARFGAALPLAGLFVGGLVNLVVLKTLPPSTTLLGISGVVYWMGAAGLTLFLLVDRRERLRRRFGHALFLTLILFVPETLQPEVSYLSHFLGFVTGAASGALWFRLHRRQFRAAEGFTAYYEDLSAFADDEEFFLQLAAAEARAAEPRLPALSDERWPA